MKFTQRTAVVTGAGGSIGQALCREFHSLGVRVAATDVTLDAARKGAAAACQESGSGAYAMDVTSSESIADASKAIYADFGKIDILVNNAGVWTHPGGTRAFVDTPEEYWEKIIDINLRGVFRVTRAFLPDMLKHKYGRIINLGSIAGEVGLPGLADYSASKAGVVMMSKTLAMEVAKDGITVNCVSPGMIFPGDAPLTETPGTWIGRYGRNSEVAELVCFLASDDSGFITGVDYIIDGGRVLGPKTVASMFNR